MAVVVGIPQATPGMESSYMADWQLVCDADEIDEEDVMRFDPGGKTYAVYNTPKGNFASGGHCTQAVCVSSSIFVIGRKLVSFSGIPIHR